MEDRSSVGRAAPTSKRHSWTFATAAPQSLTAVDSKLAIVSAVRQTQEQLAVIGITAESDAERDPVRHPS